jgi:hypothetical protein
LVLGRGRERERKREREKLENREILSLLFGEKVTL